MDRNSRPHSSADEESQPSEKGQPRYKPLAPKILRPTTQNSSPVATDEAAYELTFLNISDPQQSKTREARKFVRTQVMRNFAKEKRRQKPHSENAPKDQLISPKPPAESLRNVQELLSTAGGTFSDKVMSQQQTLRFYDRPPAQSGPSLLREPYLPTPPDHLSDSRLGPSNSSGWALPLWSVDEDVVSTELVRHCYSAAFRASNPLYVISLLIQRPWASRYPLSIDIDFKDHLDQTISAVDRSQNLLFQLAQQSPAVANALLMISASDLALRQVNKVLNDHRVIYHKAKALSLLNEAIEDLAGINYLAVLATIAILASHELVVGDYKAWMVHIMGFSRTVDMNGGIKSLSLDDPVRQLIIWSDQIGALIMNMRPFFPAAEVVDPNSRPRTKLPQSLVDMLDNIEPQSVPGADFQVLLQNQALSQDLFEVLEDVYIVAVIGVEGIIAPPSEDDTERFIHLRDGIIQRLIYLAPETHEGDEDTSMEESIRLAVLLLSLNRLFSPTLPSAYFQISHMVADRLAAGLGPDTLGERWAGYERVMLWICFIGTSMSSNNPRTRTMFIHAGVLMCMRLFTSPRQLTDELEEGLGRVMGTVELFDEGEMGPFMSDLHTGCITMAGQS